MFNYQVDEYFRERNYVVTPEEMDYVRDSSIQVSYKFTSHNAFQDKDRNWYSSYRFSTDKDFMCEENREWIVYLKNHIR